MYLEIRKTWHENKKGSLYFFELILEYILRLHDWLLFNAKW
jgi:hypothetical protein